MPLLTPNEVTTAVRLPSDGAVSKITVNWVAVEEVTVPAPLLKVTVLRAVVVLKPVPTIVRVVAVEGRLAELNADNIEAQELTKRTQADMASDSWLSKNIRPMTLIFILLVYTAFAAMSAADLEVNNNYVELLGQWGMLIMSFYFGGRTLEKIMDMKAKKNGNPS